MWDGGLILKNSLFPTRLLITEGEADVVEQLMKVPICFTILFSWIADSELLIFYDYSKF